MGSTTPTEDDGERARRGRRARALLSQFYVNPTTEAVAEGNIDSSGFDTRKYVEGLLREAFIQTSREPKRRSRRCVLFCATMKSAVDNLAEVKKLDGEMQTLVYENYSKFIMATDTIRKVCLRDYELYARLTRCLQLKSNVEQMEAEMHKLTDSMQSVSDFSDRITTNLSDRRSKLDKYTQVRGLLKKVPPSPLCTRACQCVRLCVAAISVRFAAAAVAVCGDEGERAGR